LAENGQAATAFDLLFQEEQPSWLYMMKAGATTVWEYWDGISTDRVAKGSLNHYSKGSVISFLHQNVAGLKATSPGYETFVVEPYFDDRVPDASVRLDTPFGVISAGWRRQANDVVVEVSVQGEASGSVKLPGGRVLPVSKVESVSVII
jgi:alpha-L-rhamnosidase